MLVAGSPRTDWSVYFVWNATYKIYWIIQVKLLVFLTLVLHVKASCSHVRSHPYLRRLGLDSLWLPLCFWIAHEVSGIIYSFQGKLMQIHVACLNCESGRNISGSGVSDGGGYRGKKLRTFTNTIAFVSLWRVLPSHLFSFLSFFFFSTGFQLLRDISKISEITF